MGEPDPKDSAAITINLEAEPECKKLKTQHDTMRYPRIRVRKIWEIPPRPPRLRKGYWDSVIRDVLPLKEDEALKLPFSEGCFTEGMESSPRKAARRAGIKSGGARAIYYYHDESIPLYALDVYAKSRKTNLSAAEKKAARQTVAAIRAEHHRRK